MCLGVSARAGVTPSITGPVCLGCQQLEMAGCVHCSVIPCKYPEHREVTRSQEGECVTHRETAGAQPYQDQDLCRRYAEDTWGLGNLLRLTCT